MSSFVMNSLMILAAAAAPTSGGGGTAASPRPSDFLTSPMLPVLAIMVIFLFFSFNSKRKQEREKQRMIDQMKRGDRIQTIGGILGTIVEVRDGEVLVKVDESNNTKIKFSRSAIHRVVPEEEKAQSASK